MPITTTSMALNVAIGIAVWMSGFSMTAKIVITLILLGKCAFFFYAVWMSESEQMRKIGTGICIVLNVALIIVGLVYKEFIVTGTSAATLIMLVIWSFAAVF